MHLLGSACAQGCDGTGPAKVATLHWTFIIRDPAEGDKRINPRPSRTLPKPPVVSCSAATADGWLPGNRSQRDACLAEHKPMTSRVREPVGHCNRPGRAPPVPDKPTVSGHQLRGTRRVPSRLHDPGNASLRVTRGTTVSAGSELRTCGMPDGFRLAGTRNLPRSRAETTGRMRRNPMHRSIRDPEPCGCRRRFPGGAASPKGRTAARGGWLSSHVQAPGTRDRPGAVRRPFRGGADESRPAVYLSAVNSMPYVFVRPVLLASW